MIDFNFAEDCCGCGSCAAVCPVDAITMHRDENEFPFPSVDSHKCIHCKRCDQVCPHLNGRFSEQVEEHDCSAWLFASKNDDAKMLSSSGAAFYDMAHAVLADGGIVCGCAWDETLENAQHIFIDSLSQLHRLQGSKYLQSIIDVDIYSQLEKKLKEGQNILFSGTPCQCEAVYRYVMINAPKCIHQLLLVAVICHGVSAPAVWKTYKKWMEENAGERLVSVNFRDKSKEGYKKSYCRYQFESHSTYLPTYLPSSPYMESTIVYNLALRKSCSHCDCKGLRKTIDILIGDWYAVNTGTGKLGTSCVVPLTTKGRDCCNRYLADLRYHSIEEVIQRNPMIVNSSSVSSLRDVFLRNNSIENWNNVERYYPRKYKLKKLLVRYGIYQVIKDKGLI